MIFLLGVFLLGVLLGALWTLSADHDPDDPREVTTK